MHGLQQLTAHLRRENLIRWVVLGSLMGVVSGLAASAFFVLLKEAEYYILDVLAGYPPINPAGEQWMDHTSGTPPHVWLFCLVPALGGLASGILVYLFAPEAAGAGTDAMIDAFHNRGGRIRKRVPLIKGLASAITLATNGSAGRQGPLIQIGAGLGSWIGQILKLPVRELRLMLLAGAAGCLGAIFRAPMGSAIIVTELLYREDLETDGIIPNVISAVLAYTIFTLFFGHQAIFQTPDFHFRSPWELVFYGALGLLCMPIGRLYIYCFYTLKDRVFDKISIPPHFKPALGGLLVGLVGLAVPQAVGSGYGWLQLAILGELSVGVMASVVMFKIATTSFTISSGGSGGVFAPSLFIGGMLGGVVGAAGHHVFPEIIGHSGAFVLVGMASFFAGVANVTIGAILIVCEMTGRYHLLAPLLLVSAVHLLLNRHFSIYRSQVMDRFHSPAHLGDLTINVLKEISVSEIYDRSKHVDILPEEMRFGELRRIITGSEVNDFPVVNRQKRLIGILSLNQIRQVLFEESLGDLVVVGELASEPHFVSPEEDLHEALQTFLVSGYGQLPVVDVKNSHEILGMLRHEDVISAYHQEVTRRTNSEEQQPYGAGE